MKECKGTKINAYSTYMLKARQGGRENKKLCSPDLDAEGSVRLNPKVRQNNFTIEQLAGEFRDVFNEGP